MYLLKNKKPIKESHNISLSALSSGKENVVNCIIHSTQIYMNNHYIIIQNDLSFWIMIQMIFHLTKWSAPLSARRGNVKSFSSLSTGTRILSMAVTWPCGIQKEIINKIGAESNNNKS